MARKNPVGKLAETALSTLKDPKSAAEKVVEQAKGTVALGKVVADTAGSVAGQVVQRATGRRGGQPESGTTTPPPVTRPTPEDPGSRLRAVPDVNEPAGTQEPAARTATKKAGSAKKHGDQLGAVPTSTRPTPKPAQPAKKSTTPKGKATKKAAGTKPSVAKAPVTSAAKSSSDQPVRPPVEDVATKKVVADAAAKKAPAGKTPAKKSPPKKASAKKAPAKKAAAKKAVAPSPAEVAEVIESKVAENPQATAAQPAKKAAKKAPTKASSPGDKLPARKTPAEKAPAKKAAAKEAPAKKAPAKKTPAKKAAPKTAAELVANEGPDVTTPSGIPAAGEGVNPSTGKTDLVQPGTAPVAEPPAES